MAKNEIKNDRQNKFFYVLCNIPNTLLTGLFMLNYVEFFFDDLKLDDRLWSLVLTIFALVNALNDPALAFMSDMTDRKKWGSRRLIYIRWGGIIWALVFVVAWFPWSYTNQTVMFFHALVSVILFDSALSLVGACWYALLPEIVESVQKRIQLSYITSFTSLFAGIIVILLSNVKSSAGGLPLFQIMMIGVAIVCAILFVLVSIFCHEKAEYVNDPILPLWKGIKEVIKSKSFMIFIGYNIFQVVNASLVIPYIFLYSLILPVDLVGFFIITAINGFIGNFIGMKLQPKWGIRKIVLIFGSISVSLGIGFFLVSLVVQNGIILLIGFAVINFVSSICGGFGLILQTMSMDEDELKTGSRRENTFLGVNALLTKPGDSIGPIVATWILAATLYVKDSVLQPSSAVMGIKIILYLVPAVLTLMSLIFMYFYPLHGEKLKKMYKELDILHEQKRQALAQSQTPIQDADEETSGK